jgi:hypothetical protein
VSRTVLHKTVTRRFFLWRYSPSSGLGLPPWNFPFHFSDQLITRPLPVHKHRKTHIQTPNIHALSKVWTHDPGFWASKDSACLRPLSYCDRLTRRFGCWRLCMRWVPKVLTDNNKTNWVAVAQVFLVHYEDLYCDGRWNLGISSHAWE